MKYAKDAKPKELNAERNHPKATTRQKKKMPEATIFAHSITLDHIILGKEEDSSRNGDRVAAVVFDLYTKWLLAYPDKTKKVDRHAKR